jgi:hypothetical protein
MVHHPRFFSSTPCHGYSTESVALTIPNTRDKTTQRYCQVPMTPVQPRLDAVQSTRIRLQQRLSFSFEMSPRERLLAMFF